MTNYLLRSADPARTRADVVVVGVISGPQGPQACEAASGIAAAYGRKWRPLLTNMGVSGKAGEAVRLPTAGTINAPMLVLVGLGPDPDDGVALRRAAGVAARNTPNASSVALALPAESPQQIAAVTEGHILGGYTFTEFKSAHTKGTRSEGGSASDVVVLSPIARQAAANEAFQGAQIVAESVAACRDWVNMPPGDLTPPLFADAVGKSHESLTKGRGAPKVSLEVFDRDALAGLGCGGILCVGDSSSAPARLAKVTWSPKEPVGHLALVGKGVTFDSGGLTIKPSSGMTDMKGDMAGAAAAIQATFAIARLGLPVKVTTFAPMAENMVSGSSARPGDVVTMRSGKTVEIANTDAEGRMLLADALALAVDERPDVILDIATLTGAMHVALGDKVSGVLGTHDVVKRVLAAGEVAGEAHWHMPIPEEMVDRITSSKVADLAQHDWVRWGGGLFAAAFLREFTGDVPWAHLDIAGKEINSSGPYGHVLPGGTGFGVSTLVEFARSMASTSR